MRLLTPTAPSRTPGSSLSWPRQFPLGDSVRGDHYRARLCAEGGGDADTGLAADCTDLLVAPWERRGVRYEALLHQVRPAMAGGVLATCLCPEARPQMATVRPGIFELRPAPRKSRIKVVPVELEPTDLRVDVIDRETSTTDVGIADADVIIAGGAGCDVSSWHLVEELATALGGRVAAHAAP